ncbi:copper resistance protein C [Sphaerisporangium siamense]|uniref:Methionine-rich copper-binding protein CopC n=1 Tax=Sphaerisporangium siamense TaxID=795645 RepID=A0A7W7D9A4_9ACTN|nr:copper resistance CopC family protein [Sphaerisporangium siamense]MBB4702643.1 methionine-rich copper-binding protein CopC [Sphaerisporangium siamense]GII83603.1 copper resistance protein C [Sphaerisporangium siamense]
MRRFLTVLFAVCAALALGVAPASAHNVLTGSDPEDGARFSAMPGHATLSFDQSVRADFAQVALTSPGGVVAKLTVRVADNDVIATLPASAAPGDYVIGYQILSNDGHPVTGKIGFTVTGAASAAPVAPQSPAAQASPAGTVAVSSVPPANNGGWVWGLLVAALLLSGLGIRVVARQGRPAKGEGA